MDFRSGNREHGDVGSPPVTAGTRNDLRRVQNRFREKDGVDLRGTVGGRRDDDVNRIANFKNGVNAFVGRAKITARGERLAGEVIHNGEGPRAVPELVKGNSVNGSV